METTPQAIPPLFFICLGVAFISGALALALIYTIISAKVKKRAINFAPAMLVEFIALMVCLGSIYAGARILAKSGTPIEQPPAEQPAEAPPEPT